MLGVCSEFERIAKVVLDKAEKDSSSRRKRKSHEDHASKKQGGLSHGIQPMTSTTQQPNIAGVFSPPAVNQNVQQNGFGSPNNSMGNQGSPGSNWQPDFGTSNSTEYSTPPNFAEMGFPNGDMNSPLSMNSFQQPFVPQDLWQMPMTLEWDWADMTGGPYPSFENGVMGGGNAQNGNTQHLQSHM